MDKEKHFRSKIKIPEWEMEFRADRASGPGGQNVNKTATKINLRFDIGQSKTLNNEQKTVLRKKLANIINKEDEIVVSEQSSRSQLMNRKSAIEKLNSFITEALVPEKERRETKVSKSQREKRIEEKKRRGETKKQREKIIW